MVGGNKKGRTDSFRSSCKMSEKKKRKHNGGGPNLNEKVVTVEHTLAILADSIQNFESSGSVEQIVEDKEIEPAADKETANNEEAMRIVCLNIKSFLCVRIFFHTFLGNFFKSM